MSMYLYCGKCKRKLIPIVEGVSVRENCIWVAYYCETCKEAKVIFKIHDEEGAEEK